MNFFERIIGSAILTCFTVGLYGQVPETKSDFHNWLKSNHCELKIRLNKYDYSHFNIREAFNTVPIDSGKLALPGIKFDVSYSVGKVSENADAREVTVVYRCTEGAIDESSLSVDLNFADW